MVKINFILALSFVAIIACNKTNSNKNSSDGSNVTEIKTEANYITNEKLFEGIELPVYVEKVKSKQENKFKMPTGAEIVVPANAFVDKSGNDVKGEVTLKYKEIKSPADIIIENVDMTYDSAGQSLQFMTAGMFDLRAYSGNEEVMLKNGKSIGVSYITEKQGNYNLYYFDNGWKYAGTSNVINQTAIGPADIVGALLPTEVNTEEDLIIDIKVSHKEIPELAIYKNVLWKYNGKLENKEIAAILGNPVSFATVESSGKKGEYIYKFSTKNGDFSMPVKPVFSPKAMKEAMKAYNSSAPTGKMIPKIKRTVDVTRLGLMNYDVIYKRPDAVVVKVDFKIKNNDKMKVQGLPLFHITGEDNVLVNIAAKEEITYSRSLKNKIVAVLPNHKVAVLGTTEFLKTIQSKKGEDVVVFELKELDKQINTPTDLNGIISEL
jgi:hypothetical protein